MIQEVNGHRIQATGVVESVDMSYDDPDYYRSGGMGNQYSVGAMRQETTVQVRLDERALVNDLALTPLGRKASKKSKKKETNIMQFPKATAIVNPRNKTVDVHIEVAADVFVDKNGDKHDRGPGEDMTPYVTGVPREYFDAIQDAEVQ